MANLIARRDHLLAVNARLAIPLGNTPSGVSNQGKRWKIGNSEQRKILHSIDIGN